MRIEHRGGLKFAAKTRGHEIVSDLPPNQDGEDKGMTPPEWLLASLGACVGVYVRNFCKPRGIAHDGLSVDIDWEKTTEPLRIGSIKCSIHMPEPVPEKLREPLLRVARQCMVHNTLCHTPQVDIDYAPAKEE